MCLIFVACAGKEISQSVVSRALFISDLYSEEHVADALGGSKQSTFWESQGASESHVIQTEGGIYNPAIPGPPPEV